MIRNNGARWVLIAFDLLLLLLRLYLVSGGGVFRG